MSRFGYLSVCVLLVSVAPALARTWTDKQGRSVEGDFLRVFKARVFVSSGGRTIQIPFGQLVDGDQEFVRRQLDARGQGSFLPARKKPPKPESSDAKPEEDDKSSEDAKPTDDVKPAADAKPVSEERTWTDIAGHTVRAQLLDVDSGNVMLQMKGKRASFAFNKFCSADQAYMRAEMQRRGQGEKVPAEVPVPAFVAPANPDSPPVNSIPRQPPQFARSFPRPPRVEVPRTAIPQFKFPEPAPAVVPPSSAPPAMAGSTGPSMPAPSIPPSIASPRVPTFPSFQTPQPNMPVFETKMVKYCQKCRKVVPDNLTAGDCCPHCGIYFAYEDQGNGVKKSAPLSWKTFTFGGGTSVLILIAVVVVNLFRRSNR
jgi:hypothetical protein